MLKDLERPFARLVEVTGGPAVQHTQDAVVLLVIAPVIPVATVSAEAFKFLQDSLLKQDVQTLEEIDRRRFERRIRKLTKAA